MLEKSLITHSHIEQSKRINDVTNVKMNKRENDLLTMITSFYKSARFNRFNISSEDKTKIELIEEFILKHIP